MVLSFVVGPQFLNITIRVLLEGEGKRFCQGVIEELEKIGVR